VVVSLNKSVTSKLLPKFRVYKANFGKAEGKTEFIAADVNVYETRT